jgi:hypothetical protein
MSFTRATFVAEKSDMPRKKEKSFWDMTEAERNEYVKQLDKPVSRSKTRPLTRNERALFERMRRSPHLSVLVTKDANGVVVRIERDVLRRSLKFAQDHKLTFSEVVNRSLRGLLEMVG